MAKVSGGERLADRLKNIDDRLRGARAVRVGFLEGGTYPNGTSVPLVAAVNEFGAPSRGIPPRPFFRNMIAAKSPEWGPALAQLLKDNDYDARKALDLAGAAIAGQLRASIVNFSGAPLSPKTIARKGFAKALVDTGHMLNSIDHEVT